MCVLPLSGDLTAPVPVCCSLFTSLGDPLSLISTGPLLRSRPASPGTPPQALLRGAPSGAPSGPHSGSPLPPSNVLPRDGTSAGSTLLTPLHFPRSSAACGGSAHRVGASQRFPRRQRAPEGPRLGQVAGGRVSSEDFHSLLVGCRALGVHRVRALVSRPLSDPPVLFLA